METRPNITVKFVPGTEDPGAVVIDRSMMRHMPHIARIVAQTSDELEQPTGFDSILTGPNEEKYNPLDGAYAVMRAIRRKYGTDGIVKGGNGMPPIKRDLNVQHLVYKSPSGVTYIENNLMDPAQWSLARLVDLAKEEGVALPTSMLERDRGPVVRNLLKKWTVVGTRSDAIKVPWGPLSIPDTDIVIICAEEDDEVWGQVFRFAVMAPGREQETVDEISLLVKEELYERSIFKGRSWATSDGKGGNPVFRNPFTGVREEELILPEELEFRIDAEVYGALYDHEYFESQDNPKLTNRKWVAVGKVGTGKTMWTKIVCQKALANGVTVINHRPGDDIYDTYRLAAVYEPSLVVVEDIESYLPHFNTEDERQKFFTERSGILELFDGKESKGKRIFTLMTTNFPRSIISPLLRRGRTDGLFEFASLDRAGLERLLKLKVGGFISDDMDFDLIWDEIKYMSSSFLADIPEMVVFYARKNERAGGLPLVDTKGMLFLLRGLHSQYQQYLENEQAEESLSEPSMRQQMVSYTKAAIGDMKLSKEEGAWVFSDK